MNILETKFAGLTLKNPIIMSSCGRTAKAANNKAIEEAGAGAIVLKSLFEENITRETEHLSQNTDHTESADYMHGYIRSHAISEYLQLIKDTKNICTIPVIASINCHSAGEWTQFAQMTENAGADALELNIMSIATNKDYVNGSFEQMHLDIVRSIRNMVKFPIIVKLGRNISNPVWLINQLKANGANAVVLFNRPYQPDIDINTMQFTAGQIFSSEAELAESLRWTAITSAAVNGIDIAISGGVHNGKCVVKSLLSGASAVEVSSAIYKSGNVWFSKTLDELKQWQTQKQYSTIAEYKGKMNAAGTENPDFWLRTQFLKYFATKEE